MSNLPANTLLQAMLKYLENIISYSKSEYNIDKKKAQYSSHHKTDRAEEKDLKGMFIPNFTEDM